jgi:hypothetical protein
MSKATYRTSPTKSKRRTKNDIEQLKLAIYEVVKQHKPMTVRQVFYQLVSRGAIAKSENEYKSTVCRLLVDMRRDGTIPFDWIADNTRWMRKPRTYHSLQGMLELTHETYRRSLWDNQDCYVEIWLEKDALAGVLTPITGQWDVPLMVTRGYPSVSYVYEAAIAMQAQQKPAYLYYFGDHDPSGVDINRFVEKQIREIAPDVELHFERVAVNPWQIIDMKLPTRPTKKTDSRSKGFVGESVEVDAINPDVLRELCEGCITQHVDGYALQRMEQVEAAERETLATMIESMEGEL